MRHLGLLLAAAALGGHEASPDGLRLFPKLRKRPEPKPGVETVACPRCKAGPGETCDRRTLGRHFYHMAREQAWKDSQNRPHAVIESTVPEMTEQGRFPDGRYVRACPTCGVGSPVDEWEAGLCPDCGSPL